MGIDLPADETTTEDSSTFQSRKELYEAYWLYVDCVRYVGPVLNSAEATKQEEDSSPLARHYIHFYNKKEEFKEKCRELPGSLPEYKDEFDAPRGDTRKIPQTEMQELGIQQRDGDDPIWIPAEYELPAVWDDSESGQSGDAELEREVRRLKQENRQLRAERDELRERIESVKETLSEYLDTDASSGETTTEQDAETHVCDSCGQSFSSKQALHGHTGGSSCGESNGSPKTDDRGEMERLAADLPELSETQAARGVEAMPEEERENLNHLIDGVL